MRLTVENTLGIRSASVDIEPGKIVEVVGPNASGKTSLAICAQAVLARESNPLGLSAADIKRWYAHDGADDATVMLTVELGNALHDIYWLPTRGQIRAAPEVEPQSRPEAVGLIDFTAKRGAKERAAVFQSALLPPAAEVLLKVQEQLASYLPEDDLRGALEMLEQRGWEATESVYADRARMAKREWRSATGQTYGVRVAADWRPDGWLADFDHLTIQQAEEHVTDTRDALNALHRVQAVSEAEIERAKVAVETLPGLRKRLEEWEGQRKVQAGELAAIPVAQASGDVQGIDQRIFSAKRDAHFQYDCPHCGGALAITERITGGQAIVVPESKEALHVRIQELEKERAVSFDNLTKLQKQAKPLTEQIQTIDSKVNDVRVEITNTEHAAKNAGAVSSATDSAALATAEQAVETAKEIVRLVKAEWDAARLHETITRYVEIARALGPEGVRAKLLAKGLVKLNAGLQVISESADWPSYLVSEHGAVLVNNRPVQLSSESEKWRAQAALQLTLGAITGSKVVVLDRADLLDANNRAGLERALNHVSEKTGMSVLLCSTGNVFETKAPWPMLALANGYTSGETIE